MRACCRSIGAMMKLRDGFFIVGKMVPEADAAELLPIVPQLMAQQFNFDTVAKYSNPVRIMVQKLVRLYAFG